MKSCVIFYGIGRNILEFNLFFNFLRRNLIDTDFYYFLHKEVDIIKNKRTNEYGEIDYSEFSSLPIVFMDVDMTSLSEHINYVISTKDPHQDNFKTINNLLKQLCMLKSISSFLNNSCMYDEVFIFRDDIKLDSFSRYFFKKKGGLNFNFDFVNLSIFSWHGGYNDKYFISNRSNCIKVCTRIDSVKEFTNQFGYLNAEHLLKYHIDKHKLKVNPILLRVGRVRINGKVNWDFPFISIFRPRDFFRVVICLFRNSSS
jgi:hypothetical protein